MVNFKEDEQLNMLNHSCAHLMAQAVKHLYPQAKFWVGPVVAEGFYYDIDLGDDVIRDEDIAAIEKEMKKVEAIIQSMTIEERKKPDILKASRKIRIAKGSGTDVSDVNKLLKQFEQMKSMMKMFSSGKMPNLGGMGKGGKFPF